MPSTEPNIQGATVWKWKPKTPTAAKTSGSIQAPSPSQHTLASQLTPADAAGPFATAAQAEQAIAQLLAASHHQLEILCHQLATPALLVPQHLERISAIARAHRHAQVRLLLKTPNGQNPALLALAHRLPQSLRIRVIQEPPQIPTCAYWLGDQSQLVYILDEANPQGFYRPDDPHSLRRLRDSFNHLWEQAAAEDPNHRELYL
jgi:hypothetical protein